MKPISPAAQAVLDAYAEHNGGAEGMLSFERQGVAAALRTVADQVIAKISPPCDDFDEYAQGFLAAHVKYRSQIKAIAAELEGKQ